MFSYLYTAYMYIISLFSNGKNNKDMIKWVSYRNLSKKHRMKIEEIYNNLMDSDYESKVDFKYIRRSISSDSYFHLTALMLNNEIIGVIQYRYIYDKIHLCVIDYVYVTNRRYMSEFKDISKHIHPESYVVAEILENKSMRNKTLTKLVKAFKFTKLTHKYIQPSYGEHSPMMGSLYLTTIDNNPKSNRHHHRWKLSDPMVYPLFINKLIHILYFDHYTMEKMSAAIDWYGDADRVDIMLDKLWSKERLDKKIKNNNNL